MPTDQVVILVTGITWNSVFSFFFPEMGRFSGAKPQQQDVWCFFA